MTINQKNIYFLIIAGTIFLLPIVSYASETEKVIIDKLDLIRSIKATSDEKKINEYNAQLDEAWKYFKDNSKEALPILHKQLKLESDIAEPNHFFMLDVGYFLFLSGKSEYKKTAQKLFYKIDPYDPVVSANLQQLFDFAYGIAETKDPAILPYLDKAFLSRKDAVVFVPQHSMKLERGLMNVFLYGVYGPEAEAHLQQLLQENYKTNAELSRFIVELLIWIGTDKSMPQVKQLMETQRDHDTFLRCVAYFMSDGGKQGQQILLGIDTSKLEPKSRQYFQKVRDNIEKTSFENYQKMLEQIPGEKKLSNDVVKARLKAMYENYGKDNDTHPLAILNADLPKDYLIEQLIRIRARMFHRLSDEALTDVKITSALINALRYRDK